MSLTDEQLINRIQAGNRSALGMVIDRYQGLVFTICLKVLGSREEAEEAAQDVFLKLHQRARSFRGESRFTTWLYTLAYRTAIDHQRQTRKHRRMQSELEVDVAAKDLGTPAKAEENLIQAEQKTQLKLLLNALRQQDAMIVELFYLQEQSVKEIAAILNMSVSNVKTKLFRAREKLRKLKQPGIRSDV